MTIQQLREFMAVVSEGSLRAAARSLGTAQPALSRSIKALEQSLQATLLLRTTRGISLTPAGQELHARARVLLRDVERTQAAVSALGSADDGAVSFGLSTAPMLVLLPQVIREFRSRRPGVRLHFGTGLASTLLPAVRQGKLDFAVVPVRDLEELAGLEATRVADSAPVVVCRRNHPLAGVGRIQDLAECEWIAIEPGPDVMHRTDSVTDSFTAHGLGLPRVAMSTDSVLNCLPLIAATDLLAALPSMVVGERLMGDSLVQVPIVEALPSYGIYVVRRADAIAHGSAAELAGMFISLSRAKGLR